MTCTDDIFGKRNVDVGVEGTYEFPAGPDVPVVDSQGMVMKLIHVIVR